MKNTAFTSRQVTTITGLSQRQLTYWRRTELVTPAQSSQGGHARYIFSDLVLLRTIKQLIDAGVSIQRIRKSIVSLQRYLNSTQQPLHELTLVATGDVILVLKNGQAFETLSGQQWIFPIAQLLQDQEPQSKQGELFEISAVQIDQSLSA